LLVEIGYMVMRAQQQFPRANTNDSRHSRSDLHAHVAGLLPSGIFLSLSILFQFHLSLLLSKAKKICLLLTSSSISRTFLLAGNFYFYIILYLYFSKVETYPLIAVYIERSY